MAHGILLGGGGGTPMSEDLTATSANVLSGKTFIGNDTDDDTGTGTMPNIGAVDNGVSLSQNENYLYCRMNKGAHVIDAASGYPEVRYPLSSVRSAIGYVDTTKVLKGTSIAGLEGTLTVSPATNFNIAQYNNTIARCTWARPASGAMWSGIRIVYKSGYTYPANISDGTLFYEGNGTYADGYMGNGTFSVCAWSYLTTNYGRIYAEPIKVRIDLSEMRGLQAFTAGGVWYVPDGIHQITVFAVGGGGCGSGILYDDGYDGGSGIPCGAGGGGGYANMQSFAVNPHDAISFTVGAGGVSTILPGGEGNASFNVDGDGGTSIVYRNGAEVMRAGGGHFGASDPGNGGSGGGPAGYWSSNNGYRGGGDGGENGSNGWNYKIDYSSGTTNSRYQLLPDDYRNGAKGQGQHTSTFFEGVLYCGGGAGFPSGNGGAGGGGNIEQRGTDGLGGGGGGQEQQGARTHRGGCGTVVIKWGY